MDMEMEPLNTGSANMKFTKAALAAAPGLCVTVLGALFLWLYGVGVTDHLTATIGDLLWRGAVLFLGNLLWVGLGMVVVQLVPPVKHPSRGAGALLVVVAAVVLVGCAVFRIWAEVEPAMGGAHTALTLGRPVCLLYLAIGALLGYGIRLVRT